MSARKKCLGVSTAVNRDIGDRLRIRLEIRGTRVWLGVKKYLSSYKPGLKTAQRTAGSITQASSLSDVLGQSWEGRMAKKKKGKKGQEKLNNGLFDASERGDVGEARKLLDQGEDASQKSITVYPASHCED